MKNWYLIVAGALAVFGGLAHGIIGEVNIISQLVPDNIANPVNAGIKNLVYLRWFWHVGTFNIFAFAAINLFYGFRRAASDADRRTIQLAAFMFLAMFIAFSFSTLVSEPKYFVQIPQGLAMLFGSCLSFYGSKQISSAEVK